MKKNILILNYEFPPLGGGASPVSLEIARGFRKDGYAVAVVTMGFEGLPQSEIVEGIQVYHIPSMRKKKEMSYPWEHVVYLLRAAWFMRKHLQTHYYGSIHCHFLIPTGILAAWIRKRFNIPFIVTAHGSDVPGFNTDRFQFMHLFTGPVLKWVAKMSTTIVSPSQYLANLIRERIKVDESKIQVIPNGIYPDKFEPRAKKKQIVSAGRLLPRKGFQHLVQAVSHKDLGFELHIAGDGPMRDELDKLAAESKTPVVFHGWLNNQSPEYKDLIEESAIYVLASKKENASIALLEGMSARCAMITTNVSGCAETVSDAGLLIEPGDVETLRSHLEKLTSDEEYREEMSGAARERLLANYSWESILKQYLTLIEHVANA